MPYYLVPYVGTGRSVVDPFRPAGIEGATGSIDLRPDGSVADGFALVSREAREDHPAREYLGDSLDEPTAGVQRRLGNKLGRTLDATSVRGMIAELLMVHGDAAGRTRWKPLRPAGPRYEIYLGGLIFQQAVLAGGASYAESFDKADAATLGPDLAWTEVTGTSWGVTNNQAAIQALANDSHARAEHETNTPDQFGEITVSAMSELAGVTALGVLLRFASASDTAYQWQVTKQSNGVVNEHAWAKWVAGTETYPLGTISAEDLAVGEVLRGEVNGSTLTGYKNGVNLKQITDTSITGNLRAGLRGIVTVSGAAQGDAFSFGDLSEGPPVGGLLLLGVGR